MSNPVAFTWHFDIKLSGVLCTHGDYFLFGRNNFFIDNSIEPLKSAFTIGSEFCTASKYLGLTITQLDKKMTLDQNNHINSTEYISFDTKRKKNRDEALTENEIEEL